MLSTGMFISNHCDRIKINLENIFDFISDSITFGDEDSFDFDKELIDLSVLMDRSIEEKIKNGTFTDNKFIIFEMVCDKDKNVISYNYHSVIDIEYIDTDDIIIKNIVFILKLNEDNKIYEPVQFDIQTNIIIKDGDVLVHNYIGENSSNINIFESMEEESEENINDELILTNKNKEEQFENKLNEIEQKLNNIMEKIDNIVNCVGAHRLK